MSLSNQGLKLIYNNEIRKVLKKPATIEELNQLASSKFGGQNYQFVYMDEEGDKITIQSTEELLDAYQSQSNQVCARITVTESNQTQDSSFEELVDEEEKPTPEEPQPRRRGCFRNRKFEEKVVHRGITCDGCGASPIEGVRYKCQVCPDFDYCEQCKQTQEHQHPFYNYETPCRGWWRRGGYCNIDIQQILSNQAIGPIVGNLLQSFQQNYNGQNLQQCVSNLLQSGDIQQIFQRCQQPLPKLKVTKDIQVDKNDTFVQGSKIIKLWEVKNKGQTQWPMGTRLVLIKGELGFEAFEIHPIEPKQKTTIACEIQVPEKLGALKAVFALENQNGQRFGKLRLRGKVVEKRMHELLKMGFQEEDASRALQETGGDISLAISKLLA